MVCRQRSCGSAASQLTVLEEQCGRNKGRITQWCEGQKRCARFQVSFEQTPARASLAYAVLRDQDGFRSFCWSPPSRVLHKVTLSASYRPHRALRRLFSRWVSATGSSEFLRSVPIQLKSRSFLKSEAT